MSLPRFNQSGQVSAWTSSAPADTSFVTAIPVINDANAAIEVVYKGLDAADAYMRLRASNSGDYLSATPLSETACTFTTAAGFSLFNVKDIGYAYIHAEYDAGSNTDGTVTLYVTRKQQS